MEIAKQVLDDIDEVGGRFLKEMSNGDWVEVEYERRIEKICQALREKDKANPPEYNPFRDPNRKTTLSPWTPRKRRRGQADSDDSDEDVNGETTSDDDMDGVEGSETDSDDDDRKPKVFTSPVLKLKLIPEEEMIRKLEQFKRTYGHCGVPPGWPKDQTFANWCTAQRQLYRETRSFREPNENESMVIQRLTDLGFVWDYLEWHWHDRLEKFRACRTTGAASSADPSSTPEAMEMWLADQRRQLRTRVHDMSPSRIEKLNEAGVAL